MFKDKFLKKKIKNNSFRDKNEEELFAAMMIEIGKLIEPKEWSEYRDIKSSVECETDVKNVIDNTNLELIDNNWRIIVRSKSHINNGFDRIFAERVKKRLNNPDWLSIVHENYNAKTWLEYNNKYYDAEHLEGRKNIN